MPKRVPLLVLALLELTAVQAPAQTVRGRLVDATTHQAISGALTELRDAAGHVITQVFSSPSGGFLLAAPAGPQYQLRIAAIGYARHAAIPVTIGTEPVVLRDVALSAVVVTLPELHALAGKRACGKAEVNPETFGGLLESAKMSLQVMDATLRSAQVGFEMEVVHSLTVRKSFNDTSVSADTVGGVLHEWPVRSLSIDSLQLFGFQRQKTPEEGGGRHYYGPDMQVLVSDWFLDNHCFTLDKDRSKGDTVVIKFDPAGHPKQTDVSGTLVLDRSTLTMRHMTYQLRNLPDGMPDRSAGGEMSFAERGTGLWVPTEWAIWAPITKAARLISRPILTPRAPGQVGRIGGTMGGMSDAPPPLIQVIGRDERRGRLTRIVPLGGS
jgi:hypothetical protein